MGKQRRFWFDLLQEKRQVLRSDKDVERLDDRREGRAEGGRRFQREGVIPIISIYRHHLFLHLFFLLYILLCIIFILSIRFRLHLFNSPFQPIPPQSRTHTHARFPLCFFSTLLNLPSFFLYPTDLQQNPNIVTSLSEYSLLHFDVEPVKRL